MTKWKLITYYCIYFKCKMQLMIITKYLLGSVFFSKDITYFLKKMSLRLSLLVFGFVCLTLYFSFKWILASMLMHFFNATQISILKSENDRHTVYNFTMTRRDILSQVKDTKWAPDHHLPKFDRLIFYLSDIDTAWFLI